MPFQNRIEQLSKFVNRNFPYITGTGAALVAAPTGLSPLAGMAGYGAGKVLQDRFAPEAGRESYQTEYGEPYTTLSRAAMTGLGAGVPVSLASQYAAAQQPITQQPTETAEKTLGQMQQESQRARGMGLLAKLDNALNAGDTARARQIYTQMQKLSRYQDYLPSARRMIGITGPGQPVNTPTIQQTQQGIMRALQHKNQVLQNYLDTVKEYQRLIGF